LEKRRAALDQSCLGHLSLVFAANDHRAYFLDLDARVADLEGLADFDLVRFASYDESVVTLLHLSGQLLGYERSDEYVLIHDCFCLPELTAAPSASPLPLLPAP